MPQGGTDMLFTEKRKKEQRIEQILLEQYNRYYRLAYSYVQNEADACDIVQNGAYRAIRSSAKLRQEAYAGTWVYRIMLNEVFRFMENRQSVFQESLEEMETEPGAEDRYEDVDLKRALEAMQPGDRAVVTLKYFEDMKLEEIAEILGENVNTVKSRFYRALGKLRTELADAWQQE